MTMRKRLSLLIYVSPLGLGEYRAVYFDLAPQESSECSGQGQPPSVTSVVHPLGPHNTSDLTNREARGIPGTAPPLRGTLCNGGPKNESAFVGQAVVEEAQALFILP